MYPEVDPHIRVGTRVQIHIQGHRHNLRTGVVENVTNLAGYTLKPSEYRGQSVVNIRFDDNRAGISTFRAYLRTVKSIHVKTTHEVW